ncbi:hypothetical protein TNCV_2430881 [Trichonephila clavipes]|nr:hypothetical protein TNCV_2430881 [Trichonephila clavipes]
MILPVKTFEVPFQSLVAFFPLCAMISEFMVHLHLSMPCKGQAQPISFGSLLRAFHPVSLDYIGSNGWVASFKYQTIPSSAFHSRCLLQYLFNLQIPLRAAPEKRKNGRVQISHFLGLTNVGREKLEKYISVIFITTKKQEGFL